MDIQQAMYPNATLFFQAILFIVFVALVRTLLVKPYTEVIEEREALTEKNFSEAIQIKEEAQRYLDEANALLEKGKRESLNILDTARREAEKLKNEILVRVEEETQERINQAVEEIRKSLEEEKRKLDEKVQEIAGLIAEKVLEEAA